MLKESYRFFKFFFTFLKGHERGKRSLIVQTVITSETDLLRALVLSAIRGQVITGFTTSIILLVLALVAVILTCPNKRVLWLVVALLAIQIFTMVFLMDILLCPSHGNDLLGASRRPERNEKMRKAI